MFRAWRRRRLLRQPIPQHWRLYLDRHAPFVSALDEDEIARLMRMIRVFVAEKIFIGAHDVEVTEEMKVVIAAAAARLVLYLDISFYDRLTEIVVYPSGFYNPRAEEARDGEAHDWGVVVLGWDAVLEGLADPFDGMNTAFHEFAHVLDRADGRFNGTPRLHAAGDLESWAAVMTREFERLRAERGIGTHILDEYGAKNEAEFFAVATEAFFERPHEVAAYLPDLYREFVRFYRVPWDERGRPAYQYH